MFDEAEFQRALAQPRLSRPVPEFLESNRAVPIRAIPETELQATTQQWFESFATKLDYLGERHGTDLSWLMTWAKKYWWSFLVRDMSVNDELYAPDIRYTDVTTFGRTIVGIDEFVKYNFAFFDAIPDWRYDPLPDQVYIDVQPDGTVRTVIRYLGSGHWTGPLRLYPYDDSAPTLYGTGRFIQAPAVDRYHFTEDGLMAEGETLYDFLDGVQRAGILPRDDSWPFRALMAASKIPAMAQRVGRGFGDDSARETWTAPETSAGLTTDLRGRHHLSRASDADDRTQRRDQLRNEIENHRIHLLRGQR